MKETRSLADRFQQMPPNTIFTIAGVGYRVAGLARDSDAGWQMALPPAALPILPIPPTTVCDRSTEMTNLKPSLEAKFPKTASWQCWQCATSHTA
jgi:hypothetical protein